MAAGALHQWPLVRPPRAPGGGAAPGGQLSAGYGESCYDLVKLFHSIGGHYDAIVNNLFSLNWCDATQLELQVYVPAHQTFLHSEDPERQLKAARCCSNQLLDECCC